MQEFWAIDFEASGLQRPQSYPIEVGYTNGTIEKSFLIKPDYTWKHWDDNAETIHGITREQLNDEGLDPKFVAEQMNADLAGKEIYTDGGTFDLHWNNRLFIATRLKPTFQFSFVDQREYRFYKMHSGHTLTHRALDDAKDLWSYVYDHLELKIVP